MEENKATYFFLGLGLGIAAGILFAPKSGADTRHLIRSKADEGKDYLRRRSDEVRDRAGEFVERGKSVVNRQKDHISAAVEAGRTAYREATTNTPGTSSMESF